MVWEKKLLFPVICSIIPQNATRPTESLSPKCDRVAKIAEEKGYILSSLEELLEKSDIITLHLPLTDETKNLIDGKAIAKMKRTALIINCARGGIVNEADLLEALESDRIKGAALDVFEQEPLPEDSPLKNFARRSYKLYLSPHIGSGTEEAQRQVAVEVVEKNCAYLNCYSVC